MRYYVFADADIALAHATANHDDLATHITLQKNITLPKKGVSSAIYREESLGDAINTAAHEIGHVLGLLHTQQSPSQRNIFTEEWKHLMNTSSYQKQQTFLNIKEIDICHKRIEDPWEGNPYTTN